MSKTYYTEDHEWITVDGDIATVGITNHAQDQLGDLVFVELPDTGRAVDKGEDVVVVESVKAASDVYAPISGEVSEVNEALGEDPTIINSSPEANGWMFKLKISDSSELDGLLDAQAYKALTD